MITIWPRGISKDELDLLFDALNDGRATLNVYTAIAEIDAAMTIYGLMDSNDELREARSVQMALDQELEGIIVRKLPHLIDGANKLSKYLTDLLIALRQK